MQRAIFEWFVAQPEGTAIGTADLAVNLGFFRESVFRALLRMEQEGWVFGIEERHGGLGRNHQRRWAMESEKLAGHREFLDAIARARELIARSGLMETMFGRRPSSGGAETGPRLPR